MRVKPSAGWMVVIIASLLPALLWLVFKPGNQVLSFDSAGRLTGLIGLAMLSINVILSARLSLLDRLFRGLDQMYRVHYKLACWTTIFLVLHATFITLSFAQISLSAAYDFLINFSDPALVLGKVGLAILVSAMVFVLYMWINYQWFVRAMRVLGSVVFIGGFHAVNMPTSDIKQITPLFIYMITLGLLAAFVYIYRSIFHQPLHRTYNYMVDEVIPHGDVTEIWLKPDGRKLQHYAGQFAFLKFTNSKVVPKERHPFTISSGSDDNRIRFCIKKLGDFTSTVANLKVGDKAKLEAPFGHFSFTKIPGKKFIWIAGGIGITPFLSMAHSLPNDYRVDLYWSTKTKDEAVFLKELQTIAKVHPGLRLFHISTDKDGYLTAQKVAKLSDVSSSKIMLCGPLSMMKALEKQFTDIGKHAKDIYYEEFAL